LHLSSEKPGSTFAFQNQLAPLHIGRAAAAAGDHAGAAGSLERSLELHVKVGGMASRGVAAAARALATIKSAHGHHDAAARLLERAAGVWVGLALFTTLCCSQNTVQLMTMTARE
jgi:hypothetical protein